jgi:secreted trypsin-like serine protease
MSFRDQTSHSVYESKRLLKVDVPLVNRSDCEAAYHKVGEHSNLNLPYRIDSTMLCADYTKKTIFVNDCDACSGDSGGPIVH